MPPEDPKPSGLPATPHEAFTASIDRGMLDGVFPYVQIRGSDRRLIILPGVNDALQPVHAMPRYWARFCRGLGIDHTVMVIGRRRGLPPGVTTRDLAEDCAGLIERHCGSADVLGLSMGGAIAQHLAATYPRCVRRLILAVCGACPDCDKQAIFRQWRAWIRTGDWRTAYADLIARTYANCSTQCDAAWMRTSPRGVQRQTVDPADFDISLEASMAHDARTDLAAIRAPTLIIGGDTDALLNVDRLCDLAAGIPHSRLHIESGGGHAVFEQRCATVGPVVVRFLSEA